MKKEVQTGTLLYNDLLRYKAEQSRYFNAELKVVNSKAEFYQVFTKISEDVAEGKYRPYIHFEIHGNTSGLVLNNNDLVTWAELYHLFLNINILLKNQLYISLATCYGGYLINAIDPLKKAPFFGFVGTLDKVSSFDLQVGFYEFFETLLSTNDLTLATNALRTANPDLPVKYISIISEAIFKHLEKKLYMQFNNRILKLKRQKVLEKLARANPDIRKKYQKKELRDHLRKIAAAQIKDIQSFKDYFLHLRNEPVWGT
ncbi:hypothetical protein QG516_20815 [Pedobacter gandavensis]|uniref:hypothetical protein n=1 Tax=Pedobacter gandavensis TaxID=2679963 RepID=UPI00247ACFF3|nr:hypothetical protein [Pedobacter gandavensis]WGQ08958.1 hypothetical protein QG516_20815 [Pedobacter gandavensis]